MRLMLERARSLEPESRRKRCGPRFADGTESVDSFVLASPRRSARDKSEASPESSSTASLSSASSSNGAEVDEPSVASSVLSTGSGSKNGFVNKCVARVKHFLGSKASQ
jgi:hypothetical protein